MIHIYRDSDYDCELNVFHGRPWVKRSEVVVKTKECFGKTYTYVEPSVPGMYAFGGTLIYTCNGIFPEFNTPLKLHDRDMRKEMP